jgi:hypothetical protein
MGSALLYAAAQMVIEDTNIEAANIARRSHPKRPAPSIAKSRATKLRFESVAF